MTAGERRFRAEATYRIVAIERTLSHHRVQRTIMDGVI
jgi:hypothetical protein